MNKEEYGQSSAMEVLVLFVFTLGIDFLFTYMTEICYDFVFLFLVFLLGALLPFHTMKFKNFTKAIKDSRCLIFYDLCLGISMIYIFYGLPKIYETCIKNSGMISK